MAWKEGYDEFLAVGAWLNAAFYTVPGIALLVVLVIFDVPTVYWLPVLLLYAVCAISHQLAYGLQALNVQTKVSIDYAVRELKAERETDNLD